MRKSGVVSSFRKSRRKDKQHSDAAASHLQQSSSTSSDSPTNSNNATQDMAAMTAKNYRLAKELSELRVRHREECRNVTRLSMDNMNLASKCRETMSQVRELKAELRVHKQQLKRLGYVTIQLQQQDQHLRQAASSGSSSNNSPTAEAEAVHDDADDTANQAASMLAISPKSTEDTLLLSSRSSSGDDAIVKNELETTTATTIDSSAAATAAALQAELERMDRLVAEHAHKEHCIVEESSLEAAESMPTIATITTALSIQTTNLTVEEEDEEEEDDDYDEDDGAMDDEDQVQEEPQESPFESHSIEPQSRQQPQSKLEMIVPTRNSARRSSKRSTAATSPLVSSDDFEEDHLLTEFQDEFAVTLNNNDNNDTASGWTTHFSPAPQFKFYDEEYPQDISRNNTTSTGSMLHHHKDHSSRKLMKQVMEEDAFCATGEPSTDGDTNPATPKVNSMDAFEASFTITAFPESFSPREQQLQQATDAATSATSNGDVSSLQISRSLSESPPPMTAAAGETKTDESTTVYDPFRDSPKPEPVPEVALPRTQQELEPLVIKWGSRARDRMKAAASVDPPAVVPKKLSVRNVVDLSSSSTEEPLYAYTAATTPPLNGMSSLRRNSFGNEQADPSLATPSPTTSVSSSARGSISPAKDKKISPIVTWDGVRSILPFNKSSPRKAGGAGSFQPNNPSTPTQPPRRLEPDSELYSTPPSSAASNSLQSSGDSYHYSLQEPQRPQKAGYDIARTKYEKATRPRSKLDATASIPDNTMYDESALVATTAHEPLSSSSNGNFLPERSRRLSADASLLASVSVKDRAAAFGASPPQDAPIELFSKLTQRPGPSYDESDGDIPLNTSLSRSSTGETANDGPQSNELQHTAKADSMNYTRPFDPLELESQLKRRSPTQAELAMLDGPTALV